MSKYDFRDGLIYVDPHKHAIQPTQRLWVMANYARFIRPGFVRLGVQGGDDALLATAFRSADDHRWVVVAVNRSHEAVSMRLEARHGRLPDHTDWFETAGFTHRSSSEPRDASAAWTLPPQSVTTLTLNR